MINFRSSFSIILLTILWITSMNASTFVSAENENIRYFGRWDKTDIHHPQHSWPGVFICANFTGTSIGVRLTDNVNYYNVFIDERFHSVFHGNKAGEADYILADNLENGNHSFRFSKRNIVFDEVFSFSGLILDDNATLITRTSNAIRKIEFIGDSFTAAESNEAVEQELEWNARFPVTNIDKGFATVIARYYDADYHTICRSGCGMACDWQGNKEFSIPNLYDRTLMEKPEPKWDFKSWIPDLVVICLGLNDHSGLKDKDGNVSDENSELFREKYHEFITRIRANYPGVKIFAVAAFPEWIQKNVQQVVDEETSKGNNDIYYTYFDYFEGGYVANGHPTVETHAKMADQIIKAIDASGIFQN
ncbi:MAG: GDSL-type esterase/lipase family protein [bacterium]